MTAGVLPGARQRAWLPLLQLTVTAAEISGLTTVFKLAIKRPRPSLGHTVAEAGYGFPSGHAAAAAVVRGVAAWICATRMRSRQGRVAVWAAATLAAVIGISWVYLGVHWTSDVIGGWLFGLLWMTIVITSWTAYSNARNRSATSTTESGPENQARSAASR